MTAVAPPPPPLPPLERLGHRHWPQLDARDREAIVRALSDGPLSGPTTATLRALEQQVAARLGVRHCVALNSGTAALHCAVAAAGVRDGDEVIVPAFSFMATPLAVAQHGAVPVFCDVDAHTFTLDPRRIEQLVTPRTRAIVVVHLHGITADMAAIGAVAARHGLTVVEDAAQAMGATHDGRPAGALADTAAFSTQMTKNLQGGDGGLFVTDDDEAAMIGRRLAAFGEDVPPADRLGRVDWSHGVGWNYRMHQLAAALVSAQLPRLDEFNATARANAAVLSAGLAALPVVPPQVPSWCTPTFHKYRVRLDVARLGVDPGDLAKTTALRDRVVAELRGRGVHAVLWQHAPLADHPAFRRDAVRPWHPDDERQPLRPVDADAFPTTRRVIADSFVLGSEAAPLMVQPVELMERYVEEFDAVLSGLTAG